MAIIKKIELENGVTVNYHRIVCIHNVINVETIIEIGSYINEEKRNEEKSKLAGKESMNIFISPDCIAMPYDENVNIENAYEYLKETEKYGGGKDDK